MKSSELETANAGNVLMFWRMIRSMIGVWRFSLARPKRPFGYCIRYRTGHQKYKVVRNERYSTFLAIVNQNNIDSRADYDG